MTMQDKISILKKCLQIWLAGIATFVASASGALADGSAASKYTAATDAYAAAVATPTGQVPADIWDLLDGQAGAKGALGYARSDLPTILPPIAKAATAVTSSEQSALPRTYQAATLDFVALLNDLEARQPRRTPQVSPTHFPESRVPAAQIHLVSLSPSPAPTQQGAAPLPPSGLAPALARALARDGLGLKKSQLAPGQPGQAQIAALSTRLSHRHEQLQSYRQQLTELGQDVLAAKIRATALEADKRALAQELAAKQRKIDSQLLPDLRAARAGLLSLNAEHRALVASHDQARAALSAAEHRIATELEPQIAALKEREGAEVSSLFDRLEALSLEREIAIFQSRQSAVAMEEMSSQLNRDLKPKVVDLSRQLASLGLERDTLRQQVQSLTQAIYVEYRPMLTALESKNVALQNSNTKLENQITRLEQELQRRARQVRAKQGHVDPARCTALVQRQADQLEAMTSLLALFQLEQLAPKDLRVVDSRDASAFDFVFNDLAAGWLLERRIDSFVSPDQQKMALLDSKSKKRRWSPLGSDNVLALQQASNTWLKSRGLTLARIGLPAAKGCSGRLCLTGVVDKRTRILASYIFDRDPGFFPGGASARAAQNLDQDRTQQPLLGLKPGALTEGLMRACQGRG